MLRTHVESLTARSTDTVSFNRKVVVESIKLGAVLKKLLKENKLSVRKAAVEIGIPQATLNSIANGRMPKRLDYVIKIAAYFKLSLDEILLGKSTQSVDLENLEFSPYFDGLVRIKIEKVIGTKIKIK